MWSIMTRLRKGVQQMRGNPEVVDYLNMLIGGELAAARSIPDPFTYV